ncbi:acyl-CoA dehydrogenase family protein [Actinomadura sp. 7K534]|uniref:acyl-CoA dehydrogenase family protein n=1 Tax=Actinomadura sp. 7K534 TaxID=2530366 RepID=UPI001052945D|nr:acyl-CoA dehydrogenase family protein [Actinomadura sp. 7K534]TDB92175.1 acyl-CoA dehydrogenase [Actinomadura sp. 7K534]
MDFRIGERGESLRAEVRAFLKEHLTEELAERCHRTGVAHDDGFVRAMHEAGLLALGWPEEWGGRPCDPLDRCVVEEELSKAEAPTYGVSTTHMVARAILHAGTDRQRAEIIPRALRGEILIVLGFTEPECGSDLAAARTRAVRDGDEWVVNGSKMFTTNAHIGDHVFLLARTDASSKHGGLTVFLVPLDQPGIEVQAVRTISGERTNITYYRDARVHDDWRIGEVGGGWRVLGEALQEEHSTGFGASMLGLLEAAEGWARTARGGSGRPRIEDPDVRERLGRCAAEAEVSLLLQRRAAAMAQRGDVPVAEGPMAKLFSSEALTRAAEDLFDLLGPDAVRSRLSPGAPEGGRVEHALRFSLGTTIYGGTSEIQRGIIARRGLGLPR